MRSIVVLLSLFIGSTPLASATDVCSTPDSDFAAFLDRFKNDKAFQKTRVIYPLQMSSSEPDGHGGIVETKGSLSAQEIQARRMVVIRGNDEAAKLAQGEGKPCEDEPVVQGDRATFVQYSCHTDVYGDKYEFVRKDGCWFLQHVAASGG